MLLATWNVNGIRARSQRLQEWLAERKPDVACLQELKIVEDEFPHLELRAMGYHAVLLGQPSWNGVAVIAKERPEPVTRGIAGQDAAGARYVSAKVHGIEVASVYVPNGKTVQHTDYEMKLAWLDALCELVESRADRDAPFVLGGDFNVCWTRLDSYGGDRFEGYIFHTDEERARMDRLAKAGLVDFYRKVYPEVPGFSFWDYRAGSFHKNEGMRIDLLLGTPAVASRVKDVFVDREYRKKSKAGAVPSDHAPVVAVLE